MGLREEARVQLCEFDVVVEGGVRSDVVCVADCAAGWVGRRLGLKIRPN